MHAKSFHCGENAKTVDAYVQRIWQVAEMINYVEPQILEVFKNKLPSWPYWVLFPIDNLHIAVATVKRILTKERVDSQLAGKGSHKTPFVALTDQNEHRGQPCLVRKV